jgi:hypothetical protein
VLRIDDYGLDLVVVGQSALLAIKCEDNVWDGPQSYLRDIARQRHLERAGWNFFRIRASRFYHRPERVIRALLRELDRLGISPVCDQPEQARTAAGAASLPSEPPSPRSPEHEKRRPRDERADGWTDKETPHAFQETFSAKTAPETPKTNGCAAARKSGPDGQAELANVLRRLGGRCTLDGNRDLVSADLRRTPITDDWLSRLAGAKNLKKLYLPTQISDAGLAYLGELGDLELLYLGCTRITDAGVARVTHFEKLRSLSLSFTRTGDHSVTYLKTMHNLRQLDIRATRATKEALKSLRESLPDCEIDPCI